ncbi:MAG: DMT family transporter [Lachnospiraceae bacterium]|nr:DMT family transporter [Lachnospiraceae bacterium]
MKNNNINILNILLLQLVIIIYTFNSIIAKFASHTAVWSFEFFMYYAAEVFVLGIYAICWQQMIKRFDLSVAYANRSVAILWTALWSVVIFGEGISLKQMAGILLVVAGTVIVNMNGSSKSEKCQKEVE